jgi:peptidoglycan hydrolase-like amidase
LPGRAVFLAFLSLLLNSRLNAQEVRIGVLGLFHPREIKLQASRSEAVVIHSAGETFVLEPGSRMAASLHVSSDELLVEFGGHVFQTAELHATARNNGVVSFLLTIPGRVTRAYCGRLDVKAAYGEVIPIITMDLETAVASAVAAESNSKAPPEALKAQAVVARSYFLAGGGRHHDFDFCDLTHCQFLGEPPAQDSSAAVATRKTHGIVLTYEEKPFAPMFSRSCGGRTRTPAELGLPGSAYSYFSVFCEFCYKSPFQWTRRLSSQDAALVLKGESGRLAVDRRLGWNAVPSNNFTWREEGGQVILEGTGEGHGIGLCQRGAKAMAEHGGSFWQILSHYFPNTTLTLIGEHHPGSEIIGPPVSRRVTNGSLSSIRERSSDGITSSQKKGKSVTYVSGTISYLCLRSVTMYFARLAFRNQLSRKLFAPCMFQIRTPWI